MNLFIDTNILLSFYHLTSDDLNELDKLSVLLEQEQVSLFLPGQVLMEFQRNRENKIFDALKRLKEQHLNLQFPQMCKDYEEYHKLRALQKSYEEEHTKIICKITEDVSKNNLNADRTIKNLFQNAKLLSIDETIVQKARLRFELGNPPGKRGSLGDSIIWETLLEHIPTKEDLNFVTDDKDYISALEENQLKEFLITEWTDRKKSQLFYYKRLSSFFKKHFPDIKLAAEFEKELLIKNLTSSRKFSETHSIIAKLSKYTDFTSSQRNEIVEAAITNNQIYWIIDDPDVKQFLSSVIEGYEDEIDDDSLNNLQYLLETKGEQEFSPDMPL